MFVRVLFIYEYNIIILRSNIIARLHVHFCTPTPSQLRDDRLSAISNSAAATRVFQLARCNLPLRSAGGQTIRRPVDTEHSTSSLRVYKRTIWIIDIYYLLARDAPRHNSRMGYGASTAEQSDTARAPFSC